MEGNLALPMFGRVASFLSLSELPAQAAAKWRLMWRLAPHLLERWSATGRLNAVNTAVSAITKKVCGAHKQHSGRIVQSIARALR